MVHQRSRRGPDRKPIPRWRAELPFALLVATAVATPFAVLDQGGSWHTALGAACAVLALPGAAIESMVGAVRFALLMGGDTR